MSRRFVQTAAWSVAVVFALGTALGGRGGGGGGGGGSINQGSGQLLTVSFLGFAPGPGVGFNGNVPLPEVFRDQALEFDFDGPINTTSLGGLYRQGANATNPCGTGAPVEFLGVAPSGSTGIPYYAFCNQAAARNAVQIRENAALFPPLISYIVGVSRDKPNTVVINPRVDGSNPFALAASQGFKSQTEYVYIIPTASGLGVGTHEAAAVGPNLFAPPLTAPAFSTQPGLSPLFRAGVAFGPDPIPPAVVSIVAQSGHAGTAADPIPEADPLVITFTKRVSSASINTLKNLIIRNIDVTNSSSPQGIIVPGTLAPQTVGLSDDSVYVFTPTAPYGPGISATEGFDIEVRVGSFGAPASSIPPILGIPTGLSGTQLPLSNSLNGFFRTTPCAGGCPVAASVSEGFDSPAKLDTSFIPPFAGNARWNAGSAPGILTGRPISGSPFGNNTGALGSRVQFTVDPQPPTTAPAGLFSPFDAPASTSGTACGAGGCNLGSTSNPNGGSHIIHIYESTELGSTEDSLELIEWSPVNSVTIPTAYPQYQIWCGLTNISAPLGSATGAGLFTVFDNNYNLATFQPGTAIPALCTTAGSANPDKVQCGGPSPYQVTLATTQFFPFPVLQPCFDFSTSTGASGSGVNLLFEQNIEPGNQAPNFNRYRATAFTPVRRQIARPLSLNAPGNCPFGEGGNYDIYRMRFTLVGLVSSARSLWYDTGAADPHYVNFLINPAIAAQPAGTQAVVTLEATDTPNPGPGTVGLTLNYVNSAGVVNTGGLVTLNNLRYFRFKVQFRANNLTNALPAFGSVTMAYTF